MEFAINQLAEFDRISSELLNIIDSGNFEPAKKGKITAKVIGVLKEAEKDKFAPTPNAKKILTHYRVRRTKEDEYKRKVDYVGDFNYKESEAYKLINAMSKHANDKIVEAMIKLIVDEENNNGNNIKPNREVYRSKAALYKFIQDNFNIFKQYFDAGTTIETD